MNLQHLKYAIEIEKTCSITKAADNLFMGQPNLSRAIRELEESLGIRIFARTSRGVEPTNQGKEFLTFARGILAQVEELENHYHGEITKQTVRISVPRASYLAEALIELTKKLDLDKNIEIHYQETNNMNAIKNIVEEGYHLGVLRYVKSYKKYFEVFLKEKQLKSQPICSFTYQLVMSKHHPLATKDLITCEDLSPYIEITHGDPFIPSLSITDVKKIERIEEVNKRIYVYDRAGQFTLLSEVHTTFMRVSPIPERLLHRYDLVQKQCIGLEEEYEDVLVFPNHHIFTDIENQLIGEWKESFLAAQ